MTGEQVLHYKILEKLGEGGMGVVYKAEDTKLNRTVALKFLPTSQVTTDEEKQRFEQEAKAAAQLSHANIAFQTRALRSLFLPEEARGRVGVRTVRSYLSEWRRPPGCGKSGIRWRTFCLPS